MKKGLLIFMTIMLVVMGVVAQKDDGEKNLRSLVEAEREFARTSATKGMREAFLAFLADDGIIFRPHAVNGKKWFIESPATSALLTWEPARAEVSSAGDFGYTTGPWEYRQNGKEDEAVVYGNYVSVWKKQPDGKWKVVIDTGTTNPPPTGSKNSQPIKSVGKSASKAESKADEKAQRAALLSKDRDFAKDAESRGYAAAFLSLAADDCIFFRPGVHPVLGREAIRAALAANPAPLSWLSGGAQVSGSGDMGFTFGVSKLQTKDKEPEYNVYVRIWRKENRGQWRLILDIASPAPPPPRSSQ